MSKVKRATFDDVCEHCEQELSLVTSPSGSYLFCRHCSKITEPKRYLGSYTLTEYRTAILEAWPAVRRQLINGTHVQDKADASAWLEKHGPLAQALQTAANRIGRK